MVPTVYDSAAPRAPGMRVKRWNPLRYTPGKHYRLVTPFSSKILLPFSKSIVNLVSGLKERVFYLNPQGDPKPPCLRRACDLAGVVRRVSSVIGPCNRMTGGDFIASRNGSKRVLYATARAALAEKPTSLSQLAQLGFFTKYENTVWEKQQVPRIISPRDPRFNYLLGRYTAAVEHKIFDALGQVVGKGPVIAKGMTQQAKAQLIADKLRPGWVCVGLDASRFDQTIGRELLKVEHGLYLSLFPGDGLLRDLLRCQLSNYGVGRCRDGSVAANIGAMRCSGDQNTSLGNCIISVVLAILFCAEQSLADYDILCDGDDLLLFVPAFYLPLLDGLTNWYLRWGLRMKVEAPASVPEQVEFCQSRPVWGPDGWVLVRNPAKVFTTDFAGGSKLEKLQDFESHLRAVGVCGMSMAAGIPLLQAYYQWAIANGRTGKFDFKELGGVGWQYRIQLAAGHGVATVPVSVETRLSFALAFGVDMHEQVDIEDAITNMAWSRPLDSSSHYNVYPHPLFKET